MNADAVDFIGYSDSVISYNVFAYCENEPVFKKDSVGTLPTSALLNILSLVLIIVCIYEFFENQITIGIDKREESSPTKGSIVIDLTNQTFYDEMVESFKNNSGKKFSRIFAHIALLKFEEEFYNIYNKAYRKQIQAGQINKMEKRKFLFSVDCVANEIYDHVCGYLWSKDEGLSQLPFYMSIWGTLFGLIDTKNTKKKLIEQKCETIDIFEADVVLKKDQATIYDYYNGISSVYKYGKFDPYIRYGVNKKSVKEGWLES